MSDSKQPTGAVRSADANDLDFASLPLIGMARTAAEGAAKYGRLNVCRRAGSSRRLNLPASRFLFPYV